GAGGGLRRNAVCNMRLGTAIRKRGGRGRGDNGTGSAKGGKADKVPGRGSPCRRGEQTACLEPGLQLARPLLEGGGLLRQADAVRPLRIEVHLDRDVVLLAGLVEEEAVLHHDDAVLAGVRGTPAGSSR